MEALGFRSLFLVSLCFHLSLYSAFSEPEFVISKCYENAGIYTVDSPFKTNLDTVLSQISDDTSIDIGYYNFSVGDGHNRANAIALCRGDRPIPECRICVRNATVKILQTCSYQTAGVGLYDTCLLRYSNDIITSIDDIPTIDNPQDVSDVNGHYEALVSLMERLRDEASSSAGQYKIGEIPAPSSQTIYGLVRCAPDSSKLECEGCLNRAIQKIPNCCSGSVGARIIPPVCILWYEADHFFAGTPTQFSLLPPPPPPPPPPPDGNKTTIIIVVTSVTAFILIIAIAVVLIFRKRKRAGTVERGESLPLREPEEDEIFTAEMLQLDFAVIKAATDDFSDSNKLGQGGFGPVYKGRLSTGEAIAVKRLSMNSAQGDGEFKNEIVLVGRLQHRNLVRLLGFCLEGHERLLVYEFVPNASLDHFLFDPQRRATLDWDKRLRIIGGIARGLLYLHEDSRLKIIHRDLKASNILLDAEMNAKIADFGMAKLFEVDETQGNTSRIVGTYGYMPPEYVLHGQFSVKSDVYSFGVILFEMVTGEKNSFRSGEREKDLLDFVWNSWREGRAASVIDPTMTSGSQNEMMRCIHIGLLCVQENPAQRPTMASVVLMLNSFSLSLTVPGAPAFYMNSNAVVETEKTDSAGSKSTSLGLSNEEGSIA